MKKILISIIVSLLIFSWVHAWESRDYLLETYGEQWKQYTALIDNFIEKNKDNYEKLWELQEKVWKILRTYKFKNTAKSKKTKAVIEFLYEAINEYALDKNVRSLEDWDYRVNYSDGSGQYILYSVENGKLNGSYNHYDSEWNITVISTYKDDKLDGYANVFYEWGENMKYFYTYKDHMLNWGWIEYYEDWKMKAEWNFTNNTLDWEQKYYLDDWTLIKKENLKMWIRHGVYQEWYNDWQIKVEDNSIDGKFVWKATQWYMNGQKKFESQYNENGKLHWKATSWYSNGQINIQDNWENWVLHGDRIIFNNSEATSATKQPYDYGILQVYDIKTVECTWWACPWITIEDLYE